MKQRVKDKTVITIYVDREIRDHFQKKAQQDGRSMNNYLVRLLAKMMQHDDKLPEAA